MTDIEKIAETIATDFTGAVKAANKAKQARVDGIMSDLTDAENRRADGLAEVRRMQEEAAKLAAESLRLADRVESRFRDDLRSVEAALNELRGPAALPSRPKLQAVE